MSFITEEQKEIFAYNRDVFFISKHIEFNSMNICQNNFKFYIVLQNVEILVQKKDKILLRF